MKTKEYIDSRNFFTNNAVSREEFERPTSRNIKKNYLNFKFFFGKGIRDSSPGGKLPDPQLLHEEAEFIAQESFQSFQKHRNNLAKVDQDLKYMIQTSYDRETANVFDYSKTLLG